ncbi:conserved hypothetical protein [Frankia canadensis]|uniref:Uncharacterized protein n=1 Tax=Frankia canadensis TaxID=1836972 RepID=A0A2I2KVV2_9ACTN|nr:hypothetical protein [Frankia canadensis]SNQ49776.1 conserved hypothetical protein [Frankia canadensis]SOU57066.1 conserved hypothetical protein [Frankia canadensis]
MKVGLARTPAVRAALRAAGVRPWSVGQRLDAGDILVLDASLDTALLHLRGLLLPDVEILLVDAIPPSRSAVRWPWRRLSLPRDHGELAGLRTVLPATTVVAISGRLEVATVRLEVRDHLPPSPHDPPPDHLDVLRRAFTETGLRWPQDATLTARLMPAGQPADRETQLAVAAALLAATGTIPPAALRRYVFVGAIAPDGHLRPLQAPDATRDAARAAGYRRLVVPAVHADGPGYVGPGCAVHPASTVADLVPLLRP